MRFGIRIARIREEILGATQSQFASLVNREPVLVKTIRDLEAGKIAEVGIVAAQWVILALIESRGERATAAEMEIEKYTLYEFARTACIHKPKASQFARRLKELRDELSVTQECLAAKTRRQWTWREIHALESGEPSQTLAEHIISWLNDNHVIDSNAARSMASDATEEFSFLHRYARNRGLLDPDESRKVWGDVLSERRHAENIASLLLDAKPLRPRSKHDLEELNAFFGGFRRHDGRTSVSSATFHRAMYAFLFPVIVANKGPQGKEMLNATAARW